MFTLCYDNVNWKNIWITIFYFCVSYSLTLWKISVLNYNSRSINSDGHKRPSIDSSLPVACDTSSCSEYGYTFHAYLIYYVLPVQPPNCMLEFASPVTGAVSTTSSSGAFVLTDYSGGKKIRYVKSTTPPSLTYVTSDRGNMTYMRTHWLLLSYQKVIVWCVHFITKNYTRYRTYLNYHSLFQYTVHLPSTCLFQQV